MNLHQCMAVRPLAVHFLLSGTPCAQGWVCRGFGEHTVAASYAWPAVHVAHRARRDRVLL